MTTFRVGSGIGPLEPINSTPLNIVYAIRIVEIIDFKNINENSRYFK